MHALVLKLRRIARHTLLFSWLVSFSPSVQGWKRHGSYCYFVGTETKTFEEAREHCKTSDSYLADVSNG